MRIPPAHEWSVGNAPAAMLPPQVRVESNFPRRCTPSENPNCVAPDFPQGLAVAIDRPGPKVEGTIVLGPGAAA